MVGMAAGRSYGMLIDGPANIFMYTYLTLEVVLTIVAASLLAKHRHY